MSAMMKLVRACLLAALAGLAASAAQAEERPQDLVQAYNRAGLALFDALAREATNPVVSPYSIGTAMAMVSAGAQGDTAAQLAEVLAYPVGPGELATELPALDRALSARVTQRAEDGDAAVTVANALHLANRGDLVAEAYRELLRTQFDAELFTGSDLAAINGWVSDRTQGRIDRILESLDPLSVAVLLNAVHFKAGWAHPFRANATAPAPFHLSGGETVDVPTMQVTASFPLVTGADFDAIMLPYAGERLAMVVFSPAPAGGDGLSVETVRGTIDALVGADAKRLRLSMPKFKSEFGADLVPAFAAMGLTLPFDGGRADFAGMIDSKEEKDRVHITQIRHKAFIEVDENGTEAAASTAVELAIRSVAPPADDFRIDRPFTYMIVDRASGAILFVGRLSDPRPQAAQ